MAGNATLSRMLGQSGLSTDQSQPTPVAPPTPVNNNSSSSVAGGNSTLGKMLKQSNIPLSTDNSSANSGMHIFKGLGVPGAIADAVQTALDKKMIPQGILNDAALGIGLAQGWCGVYAGKISTASNVGDYWNQKIATANKTPDAKNNIQPGYKVVVPLGVKKGQEATANGHVMVALTRADSNGNVVVSQSNADGRQNKGEGPGIATYGIINVNDLNKRYGGNWGAVPGQLKVNPFKQGNTIPVQAQPTDNGSETQPSNVQPDNWLTKSIMGAAKVVDHFVPEAPKKLTNDQAPPIPMNIDDPKNLAKWVLDNNITDLQSKSWWVNSPVKGAAWDIISQAQGKGDTGKRFSVDQHAEISQGTGGTSDFVQSVQDLLDPNGFLHSINAQKNTLSNLKTVGQEAQKRVQEKVFNQPEGTLANNPVTRALGTSVYQIGQGLEGLGNDDGHTVDSLKNIVFGGAGLVSPGMATFNTAVQLPVVKDVADKVFSGIGAFNQGTLDLLGVQKGEFRDLLQTAMELGEFKIAHEVGSKVLDKTTDLVLNKKVTYTAEQMKGAFSDVTTGNKTPGITDDMRAQAQKLITDSAEGVKQKEMLRQSYKEGITVKQARDFVGWFNKFFKNVNPEKATPEFQKLLTDGKQAAAGKTSPLEFTNEARDIMARGESATLRDKYENGTALDIRSPEALIPGENGKTMVDTIAEEKARLTDLQNKGSVTQVQLQAGGNEALKIQTYTASDNKVGVGFTVETDAGKVIQPITGKYSSPREAVRSIIPKIEEAIGNNSDIASEAIRNEIAKLETSKYKEISSQPHLMPHEDVYRALKAPVEVKGLSRELVQSKIDKIVTDYVENTLKPTAYKGVSEGRISQNPEWYRQAVKDNNGRQPTISQLKKIATEHLMNGVKDESIGHLPPNAEFRQLVQELPNAKPEKIPMTEKAVKPIKGTGEKAVRGLSLGVEQKAVENNLTSRLENLPEYKQVNMKDQAAKASELLKKNPELARKIALGQERPPEGILPESVFVAVENDAIAKGDIATITALARESGLSAEATTMGQRLRALAERDPESPVGAFESIIRAREQELERRLKSKKTTLKAEKEKVVKEIKQSMKKTAPTKGDWSSFIDSLKC